MATRKLTGIKGLKSPKPSNKPSIISQKNKQRVPITLPRSVSGGRSPEEPKVGRKRGD